MKKLFTKEVRIALVAIVGIVILFFGLNFLKGLNVFDSDDNYYLTFDDLQGMGVATPVYADGYKVGAVKSIDYNYGGDGPIRVKVGVDPDMRIPKGSTAEIAKDLMGNIQVNLLLANNPRERVNPGDVIPGGVDAGIMGKVQDVIPTVERLMPKLDSILTSVNRLLADPAIAATLGHAEEASARLATSAQELDKLLAELNRDVPGVVGKANGVLDNAGKLTSQLAGLDVQGTLDRVNATLESAHAFTEKLNSNQGTLGKLMNDDGLYNHLNATARDADSLVVDLKAHPKRYVHFSVFGGKNK